MPKQEVQFGGFIIASARIEISDRYDSTPNERSVSCTEGGLNSEGKSLHNEWNNSVL